ncbi:thiamine pyrophosphokinase-like protein 1 [Westerdykella ornata]|uniref:Thiamine pyrophosphokinase n=1 Tax=Westerdykella ornata TaxID=318751 RepID=A0A6A6JT45_WESOR|nr:thiamine pyrophosphokinase-like protein 1 [Westerdykella ornata]KAF2279414.1 thiamine pyrophosphokinase-like protein 1 [Westerdykella ornata]
MHANEPSRFRPAHFLAEHAHPEADVPLDLVILNQPIHNFHVFARVWKHAEYRICADGGANRLYDMFEGPLEDRRQDYLPHSIHGDLDSLRDDVRAYYESHGVDVSQDHDQESTDFGKTMQKIASRRSSTSEREVVVLGTLGGRVDQGLGLLHEIFREELKDPLLRLWLISEASVSFILEQGLNIVEGLKSSGLFTKNMGLVPIYGPAVITTSGLEWDVKDWDTQMGTRVSSSNHVISDEVQVNTTAPILFTIERNSITSSSGPGNRRKGT